MKISILKEEFAHENEENVCLLESHFMDKNTSILKDLQGLQN